MQDKQETYFLLRGGNISNFPFIFSVRVNVLPEHKTRRPYCPAGGAGEISTLSLKTKTKKKVGCILSEVSSRRRIVINLTIKMSKYWKTVKSTRCLGLSSSMISIRCILETSGKYFALLSARCQRRLQNRYVCLQKRKKNLARNIIFPNKEANYPNIKKKTTLLIFNDLGHSTDWNPR